MLSENNEYIIQELFQKKSDISTFLPYIYQINDSYFPPINKHKDSILHFAVKYNRMDIITQILKRTNFLSPKNDKSELPIHLSCEMGLYEISLILLKKMSNLNMKDQMGLTVLNKAINSEYKNRDLIMYLMKNGADINSDDINGENVLMNGIRQSKNDSNLQSILDFEWEFKPQIVIIAVQRGSLIILEKILKKIEKKEWNRNEALDIAIRKNRLSCLKLLIKYGFGLNQEHLKIAIESGFAEIWYYIKISLFPQSEKSTCNQNSDYIYESSLFSEKKIDDEEKINLRKKVQRLEMIIEILKNEKRSPLFESESKIEPYHVIKPTDLRLFKKIGSGGFSTVYKGDYMGTKVAVKCILNNQDLDQKILTDFYREVNFLQKIRHPSLINMIGVTIHENRLCIITEYMKNKSLLQMKERSQVNLSKTKKIKIALQIAQGMIYLHNWDPPILHRDLKSANCLLDENYNVKIADFGLAKYKLSNSEHTNSIGTAEYMAPEFISNQKFLPESDVFSFGIVMWELFSEEKAFEQTNPVSVIYAISAGKRPDIAKVKISEIKDIIEESWSDDYKVRPNFKEILERLKGIYKINKFNKD